MDSLVSQSLYAGINHATPSRTEKGACVIDWNAFDWPTFGSLMQALSGAVVGGFAVLGAYKVGLRQVGITSRQADIAASQTDILAQQVAIETKRLAHELYERRYKTFDATAAFLIEAANKTQLKPSPDIESRFLVAVGESIFLHPPQVTAELKELYAKVHNAYSLRRKMAESFARHRAYEAGDPEIEYELQNWMNERISTLHSLFPHLVLN